MASDAINTWLNSQQYAQIDSLRLRPKVHPTIKDTPLSVQRGQAEAFYLQTEEGISWIAKKFYTNKCPDASYLEAIHSILPSHKAFRCGTERQILTDSSLKKTADTYYSSELADYLKDTVLMLQIEGVDWACLTDRLRNSKTDLIETDRIKMCKNLANTVKILEESSISHRDLSNGNIFIDPNTFEMSLIDFDSLYHSSLQMPVSTTIGSEGYTAPFIDADSANLTFCKQADRFALAILIVEFLLMGKNSPFSHEGGIFTQEDINQRFGKTIVYAEQQLQSKFPGALKLFKAALNSNSFSDCPSPDDWMAFYSQAESVFSVNDFPEISLRLPQAKHATTAKLPDNPWAETQAWPKNELSKQSINKHYLPSIDFDGDSMFNDTVKKQLAALEFPLIPKNRKNYSLPTESSELFRPKIKLNNFPKSILQKNAIHIDPIRPLNNTPWAETDGILNNEFKEISINRSYLRDINLDEPTIFDGAAKNHISLLEFPLTPKIRKSYLLSTESHEPLFPKKVDYTSHILPLSNRVDTNQRGITPDFFDAINKKNTQNKPINDLKKKKER